MADHTQDNHTDDEQRYHLQVIAEIVARWRRDEIGVIEKRRLIAAENQRYFKGPARGDTSHYITSVSAPDHAYATVLAESSNVPLIAAQRALAARRAAYVRAGQCTDRDEGNRIRAAGVAKFHDMLKAAAQEVPTQMPLPEEDRSDEWYER